MKLFEIVVNIIFIIGTIHFMLLLSQLMLGSLISQKYSQIDMSFNTNKKIAIVIPVCNESPLILKNTIKKCQVVENYSELLIIENSSIEEKKESLISVCKKLGVSYLSIPNMGNKAKALNYCLKKLLYQFEYVALLDVDQQPEKNFISELLPLFGTDKKLALVQLPQDFLNFKTNLISHLYSLMQKCYFHCISDARSKIGFSTCFGTNCLLKLKFIREVGFFDEECQIEDIATSFKINLKGYSIKYVNKILVKGLAPTTIKGLFVQFQRYVIGNNQLFFRIMKGLIFGKYEWKNWYIILSYLHTTLSLTLVSLIFYLSFFFLQVNSLIFYINSFLFLSFITILTIKTKNTKIFLGNLFFFFLVPMFLIFSLNPKSYNTHFKVTPKMEDNDGY